MNELTQTIHIARKDMRHLYPEIITLICLMSVLAWSAPTQWPGYAETAFEGSSLVSTAIHALIPLAWLIMISRLVHDESLVGDRQFWLTRPYRWYTILTAKLAFLVVFAIIPFLAMQMYLLHHAGIPLLHSIPAMLKNLGIVAIVFWLPFLVLAAVTASFGPLILSFVGGILYLLLVGLGETFLVDGRAASSALSPLCFSAFVVALIAILVAQYKTRQTRVARIALVLLPVVVAVIAVVASSPQFFEREYRGAWLGGPVAAINTDPMHQPPGNGRLRGVNGGVVLIIPTDFSNVPVGGVEDDAARVELTGTNGFHWASAWKSEHGDVSNGLTKLSFLVPQDVVTRAGDAPLTMRLSLAMSRLHAQPVTSVPMSETDGLAPGGGVCSLRSTGWASIPVCRYPFRGPERTRVLADVGAPCLASAAPTEGETNLNNGSAPLAFDPVFSRPLNFDVVTSQGARPYPLCPGSPIGFVTSIAGQKVLLQAEASGLKLSNFLARQAEHDPANPLPPGTP